MASAPTIEFGQLEIPYLDNPSLLFPGLRPAPAPASIPMSNRKDRRGPALPAPAALRAAADARSVRVVGSR